MYKIFNIIIYNQSIFSYEKNKLTVCDGLYCPQLARKILITYLFAL